MRSPRPLVVPLVLFLVLVSCAPEAGPASLVLRNGTIVTMDSTRPRASALAVRADTIVAVGSEEKVRRYTAPETRVIDLEGRLAVPGFIESHGHFMGLGQSRMQLDLMDAETWGEIVAMVDSAAATKEPGEWIRGRGWHQEKWEAPLERSVRGFPTHHRLSEVAPRNPVLLTHASGHALIVNRPAMDLAGIGRETEVPEGGDIIRDDAGRPTGVLVDAAEGLAHRALDASREGMSRSERRRLRRRQVELAAREALSHGVTTFHDQGVSFETLELYRELASRGELPLRVYALVSQGEVTPEQADELAEHRTVGFADHQLTVRAVGEVSADGALGSRSAWMLEPYRDRPGAEGLNVTSMSRIAEIARISLDRGFQVAVHAIGDRANREVLDLFASVFDSAGVEGDSLRWRIEHAQHLHPDDIPRFGELGVIASMQGIHACSDAPYVVKRLGPERAREGAYAWRRLWETGAMVTNGTDAPVEDVDPIASFHCTVTRTYDGQEFFPGQALSRERALRSYTLNGAYAGFEEALKGSLEPGKLADVAVLSRDIMSVPADSIPGTRVDLTLVGGEVVYRREASSGQEDGSASSGPAGGGEDGSRWQERRDGL